MHYAQHILLFCVTCFSCLSLINGQNVAKTSLAAPKTLSVFAKTLGSILEPTFGAEITARSNRSSNSQIATSNAKRREARPQPQLQIPANNQNESPEASLPQNQPINPNNLNPFQYDRAFQFQYPSYAQQAIPQNYYPQINGQGATPFQIDPRLIQNPQLQNFAVNQPINPNNLLYQDSGRLGNIQVLENKVKTNNAAVNTLQSLEANNNESNNNENVEKIPTQNRPADGPELASFSINPLGNDQTRGNLRLDNKYATGIGYERFRQNFYSIPSPFDSLGGYRSPLADRYSNFDSNFNLPQQNIGNPLNNIGGPANNIGGPINNIGSPLNNIGGPLNNIGGLQNNPGVPVGNIGGPSNNIGGPLNNIGNPNIGGPAGNFQGINSLRSNNINDRAGFPFDNNNYFGSSFFQSPYQSLNNFNTLPGPNIGNNQGLLSGNFEGSYLNRSPFGLSSGYNGYFTSGLNSNNRPFDSDESIDSSLRASSSSEFSESSLKKKIKNNNNEESNEGISVSSQEEKL